MKSTHEIVQLDLEETKQVSGGYSFGSYNLARTIQPRFQAYEQAAVASLAPTPEIIGMKL